MELVHEVLHFHWPDCAITTLSSCEAFEAAALRRDFSFILSDYTLPGYCGLDALAFARAHCPEKPFIFFSGTIGEERAIQALTLGATDYILKDRAGRLVPAITAALAQAEQAEAVRRGQEKIREQASLLDKSREAICVVDARGTLTYWNASAERLYGWAASEAMGRNLCELLYANDQTHFGAAYGEVLRLGEWRGELRPQPRLGECVLVESFWSLVTDDSGHARSILITDADITGKRKLENQILRSRRLETLGLLVGGIAHDLNNMVAPILTSVELLQQTITLPDDRDLLEILDTSARHGAELIRQLFAFAKGEGHQRAEIAVDKLVASVRRLLQNVLPASIELRALPNYEPLLVNVDATQFRQVLLNLCINARDAMAAGGTIEISAKDVCVDSSMISAQGEVKPGNYVQISVSDTGTGIPPEIIERIFDPYFTTKQVGKGTGLGLVNIAEIVKSHDGFLRVESKWGAGTVFHLYLPALASEAPAAHAAPRSALGGRGESILLIEDDEGIRTVLSLILNTQGYRVTVASDGEEGLALFRMHAGGFSIAMTDLSLPGTSGVDVIRSIHAMKTRAKLIAFSGSPLEEHAELLAFPGIEFLNKPISVENLLGALRRVLDAPHAGTPGNIVSGFPLGGRQPFDLAS